VLALTVGLSEASIGAFNNAVVVLLFEFLE
jgi:hypothetical protein